MPEATSLQVQDWSDQRSRPRSEVIRALVNSLTDDIAASDSVRLTCTNGSDWKDSRESVPNNLTPADLLAIMDFAHDIQSAMIAHKNWPIVERACVRPV